MKKILGLLFAFGLLVLSGCNSIEIPQPPEGKVLLEEFGDFQCPACKANQPLVHKLKEHFGDKLVMRFVHFPLPQHENAFHAAEAAECVREGTDEQFWKFVDKVYENQSSLKDETYKSIAKEIGLDETRFAECLSSGEKAAQVRKDMLEGKKRKVNSTPTFFLNGELLESRKYEAIVLQIEGLLGTGNDATPENDAAEGTPEKSPEEAPAENTVN